MRDEQDNSDIWGLEWDVEKKVLHKIGIIKDEKAHLSSLQKAGFRYDALKMMNEEFETSDWVKVVVEAENEPRIVSRATAHNWLNRLVQDGFIEKTHQGVYRKKGLTVI
jgi:hypothetical protein